MNCLVFSSVPLYRMVWILRELNSLLWWILLTPSAPQAQLLVSPICYFSLALALLLLARMLAPSYLPTLYFPQPHFGSASLLSPSWEGGPSDGINVYAWGLIDNFLAAVTGRHSTPETEPLISITFCQLVVSGTDLSLGDTEISFRKADANTVILHWPWSPFTRKIARLLLNWTDYSTPNHKRLSTLLIYHWKHWLFVIV